MRCPSLSELPLPPPDKMGWPWTETDLLPLTRISPGNPWLSICIVTPSYNQAPFLEEAIRSVLMQGYPNLEYIVMDGGSTDGSVEIIRKYQPWLSYIHIGPDGGQAAAIAEGFRHATGEILAWLNSDDCYLPGALWRVARFFATHPRVVFGNGDVNLIDAEGRVLERIYAIPPNRLVTANTGLHCWPQQGCFWRREAFEHVGGVDETLRFCMDRDLFLRLIAHGPSQRIPGPPLACFRLHADAKSATMLRVAAQEDRALIARYGSARWRNATGILRLMWWVWGLPTWIRFRLNRMFGWEW